MYQFTDPYIEQLKRENEHDAEAIRLRGVLTFCGFDFVEFRPAPVLGSN